MKKGAVKLKKYLAQHDMSQQQFAQISGVNYSVICRIVRGDRLPGIRSAMKISEALGECSMDATDWTEEFVEESWKATAYSKS